MRIEDAPIERPCTEDFDRMHPGPDGVERYCEHCRNSVHDLSAMGPERARAFLATNRGSSCISYLVDRRGDLVFVPLTRLARAASLAASLAACTPHGRDPPAPRVDAEPAKPHVESEDEDYNRILGPAQSIGDEEKRRILETKAELEREQRALHSKAGRAKRDRRPK